jgi:H+/Cl- antiporter ClcA
MYKGLFVALLVIGILLTIFGISEMESFGSDVSRFFTGSPTDRSMWLLIGGIACGVIGLFGLLSSRK